MRELAVYDYKNYKENGTVGKRPSARGIIICEGKIAMVHSLKYDYYKFPGGGIDSGESNLDALMREVEEETGLIVIPESIQEYGLVLRKEKGKFEDIFIQENFFYFCDVEKETASQKLDDYEADEEFVLEWVKPELAIEANLHHDHKDKVSNIAIHMMEREANVLSLLIRDGRFLAKE